MPIANPCPPECKFDWVKFHKDLDVAVAHIIEEADPHAPPDEYMPSQISLYRFLEYSNAKQKLQQIEKARKK